MAADSVSRRAERISLHADIDFRRPGDHRFRGQLLDFSSLGCRLEVPVEVSLDDVVWVSFPGLKPTQGYVCWVDGRIVGIEFDRPLYPAVFEAVHTRMRDAA